LSSTTHWAPARRRALALLRWAAALPIVIGGLSSPCGAQAAHFSGSQSTIAGGVFLGVGVDGAGNIYTTDGGRHAFKETPLANGYVQSTITSDLNTTYGLTADARGNLYILDTNNARVLKEAPSNGGYIESTIANFGDGFWPIAIAVDGSGDVFAGYPIDYGSDRGSEYVDKTAASNGSYIGMGVVFGSHDDFGFTADLQDNLYIADSSTGEILKLTPVAGSGSSYTQSTILKGLSRPVEIAADANGNLYIGEDVGTEGLLLKETLSDGSYTQSTVATSGLGGFGTILGAMAVDDNENVYIASGGPHGLVKKVPPGTVNFGPVSVGATSPAITLIFTFDTAGTLGRTAVLTQGAPGLSFADAGTGTCAAGTSYKVADSCSIDVTFTPQATGTGSGVAEILAVNGSTLATAALTGTGVYATQTTIEAPTLAVLQGQPLNLTANVAAMGGTAAPTGQVTFAGMGNPAPTATLNAGGTATWTSSNLAPGAYLASAVYEGDATHVASTSQQTPVTVFGLSDQIVPCGYSGTFYYGQPIGLCAGVYTPDRMGVPGVAVMFTSPEMAISPATAVTNASGEASTSGTPLTAGTVTTTVSVAGLASTGTIQLTITPVPLHITVRGGSRLYGEANPSFSSTVKGLLNGDTVSLTYQTAATPASPVGFYPVTASVDTATQTRYSPITIVDGTLHVRPAVLRIFPKGEGITYGQTPATPTAYSFTGFVNGDTASVVSGAPVLSTTVTSTTPAGIYKITSQVGSLNATNYTFYTESAPLEVYRAPLTVTANNVTMTQGSPVPPLTYTLAGFVNGDTASVVSGAPELLTAATSSSPPGTYAIAVRKGTLTATNYVFVPVFGGGSVTVTP
jgi:hypothetical protein